MVIEMGNTNEISPDCLARYRKIIGLVDIEDDRKDDVIRTVYRIMQAFVDNAFDISSPQLALKNDFQKASQADSSCDSLIHQDNSTTFGGQAAPSVSPGI